MPEFFANYSGALLILILSALVLGTLLILVPQLLRAHQRNLEWQHEEHMKALEQGQTLMPPDVLARAAGRTATLVPMVIICAAGVVSCFLIAYRPSEVFSVALTVWCVAGAVSLTAITGGVALMGRLAGLKENHEEDEVAENPTERVRGQD
jgi:hypothetical protein